MKRTNKKKKSLSVDAILTADWHLRESTPTCRTDDFEEAQWAKVKQVSELQQKHGCPILHAGDLFDHWKPSPRLLSLASENMPDDFISVYGNHDLPQHSLDLVHKSGLYNLIINGKVERLEYAGERIDVGFDNSWFHIKERSILLTHVYTYTGKVPFPGAESEPTGNWLLDEHPDFDLIVTGDNHIPFVCKEDERYLVNPGSLTRQKSDQIDHRPRVYLYNARKNKIKKHYLDVPDGEEVISRVHIEKKEERDERISAFVERLGTEWEADLDFEENLNRFIKENDISEETEEICFKALDAE